MSVIYTGPTKFEEFINNMSRFPFIRIALFCIILAIVCLGFEGVSMIFVGIAGMAIISRLFNAILFPFVSHILMKITAVSLWIGIEFTIITYFAQLYLPENIEGALEIAATILFLIPILAFGISILAFIIRIFIALFGEFF